MEELRHEFERYAQSKDLVVVVWIEGGRYEYRFTDSLGNVADPDSVREFKSLAREAAAVAGLTSGQAGPEEWKLWLRHLCEVDPKFQIIGEGKSVLSERNFNSLKESGAPIEGYVCQVSEFTEADLLEYAHLIYSKKAHEIEFDQFFQILRATAALPQNGDEPRIPRVGESIRKYTCESKWGELPRIFHASAIRLRELGCDIATEAAAEANQPAGGATGPTLAATDAPLPESVPTGMQTTEARGRARAESVANVISELNTLRPQLFDDEREYERLEAQHPEFMCFQVAKGHPNLKLKIRSIQGSRRHVRLAQEIVAAQYELAPATIKDDWKHYKPGDYRNGRHPARQV